MAPHWKGEAISLFPNTYEGLASGLGVVTETSLQRCDAKFGYLFSSQDFIGAF